VNVAVRRHLLAQAADVIGAAVVEADRVLADRKQFVLDTAQWNQCLALPDRPRRKVLELEKLLARPCVLDAEQRARVRAPSRQGSPRAWPFGSGLASLKDGSDERRQKRGERWSRKHPSKSWTPVLRP